MNFDTYKSPYTGISTYIPYASPPAPPGVSGLVNATPRSPGSIHSSRFQMFKMPYTGRALAIQYISPPAPRASAFYNTEQTATAYCEVGSGSNSATVSAGVVISFISQQSADQIAYAQALELAVAGLVCCYSLDPQPDTPDFSLLLNPIAYPGTNQYGLEGNEEIRQDAPNGVSQLFNWTICPECDFCDGPEVEGVTQLTRFATRWALRSDPVAGTLDYGIDGEALSPVPADLLVGVSLFDIDTVSISFDANARACFAIQAAVGTVQIRRYVAGTPTTHSFPGDWPRLFYDGILQRDSASVDLVCVYLRAGIMWVRFQRDNFAIEYEFLNLLPAPARVTKVERFGAYQYTYYLDASGQYKLARSSVYPPFPVIVEEPVAHASAPAGGEYFQVTIDGGSYTDPETHAAAPAGGVYADNVIREGPYSDVGVHSILPTAGTYALVVVTGGSPTDAATHASQSNGGSYVLVSADGGTYQDNDTHSVAPAGGSYT